MAEETPSLLPFSETYHPTLATAKETRELLAKKLLPELARPIVSFGYNPWLAKRRDGRKDYRARSLPGAHSTYSVAGLYLSSKRIPNELKMAKPQRIIFQTRAADQGWAAFGGEGTFENSHTWFEASILRPRSSNTQFNDDDVTLEGIPSDTWWNILHAESDLKAHGWDFVKGEGGRLTWTVCNNLTACSEFRNYRVEWKRGVVTNVEDEKAVGTGKGFLELLGPGCVVALWARVEQGCWVNTVRAATIEIEYEFL